MLPYINLTIVFFSRLWAKYDKHSDGSMLKYMDFLEDLSIISKSTVQEGMTKVYVDTMSFPSVFTRDLQFLY